MPLLDVARIDTQGSPLLVVFVPPETDVFSDRQYMRLRDLLIAALIENGLTGELVAVWEVDGQLRFLGNPHWRDALIRTGYAGLRAKIDAHITVD